MKMQIVIEISKEDYDSIKYNTNKSGSDYLILNGKILPTGHGRLIDADAFSGNMFCDADLTNQHTCYDSIRKLLDDAKTIIEADNGDGNTWHDIPADEMSVSQLRAAVKDLRKILAEVINNAD
jgi:hypothetical protein